MIKIDLLFIAHNRLAFTEQAWYALVKNTNFALVDTFTVYIDNCTDGTKEFLNAQMLLFKGTIDAVYSNLQLPVAIMNDYLERYDSKLHIPNSIFAKIDNDVIVPPHWLDDCAIVMEQNPKLDLLGIEPAWSRTQAPWNGKGQAVIDPNEVKAGALRSIPCTAIGGIGLMRRDCFLRNDKMIPHSKYGGFTDWQWRNKNIEKGWMAPALKLFLLDRLPMNPWKRLSEHYKDLAWQRAWTDYDMSVKHMWEWWEPVVTSTISAALTCVDLAEIDKSLRSN